MPRQPLANTPGLPPYGQRSSERRKEQNRIAQRQLRERRQQQEAAQALKLQQQQSEIRRLHRLIADLQNENFVLRSQGHTRRRQSVIPISSLSRGLLPLAPAAKAGLLPTLEPNFKSLFARHSVDYSSLHGAGIHTGGSSHRISEPRHFKSWSSEDQRASTFAPHFRQPAVRGAVQYLGQQASRGPTRLHTGTSEDINKQADLNPEEAVPASNFCGNTHSSGISAVLMTPKPPTSNWLSRNTTPPMGHPAGECPTNAWLHSPQKLQRSPQLDPTPKTENSFFSPSSGDLASFWAGQPPNSPNKHGGREDVEHFSAPTLSIVPSDFFPASTPLMSSDRIQLRKTSESASSDTNSLALDSDNHSAFSSMSINQVHLPFIPPEVGSHHLPRCLSPTATASSPEAQIEERSLIGENKPIFFRSPFKGSNDSEMQEQPNFGLPLSWIETKKFSVEASSPLPIHAKSMFFEINEMWGSDF